jgi:hypothetical protein
MRATNHRACGGMIYAFKSRCTRRAGLCIASNIVDSARASDAGIGEAQAQYFEKWPMFHLHVPARCDQRAHELGIGIHAQTLSDGSIATHRPRQMPEQSVLRHETLMLTGPFAHMLENTPQLGDTRTTISAGPQCPSEIRNAHSIPAGNSFGDR